MGVEIYGSHHVEVIGNRFWGNLDVIETGTDARHACGDLTIVGNVAWAVGNATQHGIILRCAAASLVAHNTLVGLDLFAFDVSHQHGPYGASVAGLRIVNNVAVGGRAFSIDSSLPRSVEIDYNLVRTARSGAQQGGWLAYVAGHGSTRSLAEFRTWTGFERHGKFADPRFFDAAGHDFTLRPDSPAVDAGIVLPGRPFASSAPDLGFDELDP